MELIAIVKVFTFLSLLCRTDCAPSPVIDPNARIAIRRCPGENTTITAWQIPEVHGCYTASNKKLDRESYKQNFTIWHKDGQKFVVDVWTCEFFKHELTCDENFVGVRTYSETMTSTEKSAESCLKYYKEEPSPEPLNYECWWMKATTRSESKVKVTRHTVTVSHSDQTFWDPIIGKVQELSDKRSCTDDGHAVTCWDKDTVAKDLNLLTCDHSPVGTGSCQVSKPNSATMLVDCPWFPGAYEFKRGSSHVLSCQGSKILRSLGGTYLSGFDMLEATFLASENTLEVNEGNAEALGAINHVSLISNDNFGVVSRLLYSLQCTQKNLLISELHKINDGERVGDYIVEQLFNVSGYMVKKEKGMLIGRTCDISLVPVPFGPFSHENIQVAGGYWVDSLLGDVVNTSGAEVPQHTMRRYKNLSEYVWIPQGIPADLPEEAWHPLEYRLSQLRSILRKDLMPVNKTMFLGGGAMQKKRDHHLFKMPSFSFPAYTGWMIVMLLIIMAVLWMVSKKTKEYIVVPQQNTFAAAINH